VRPQIGPDMTRPHFHRIAFVTAVALSCAAPGPTGGPRRTPMPSAAIDAYRSFAQGDCAAVREKAQTVDASKPTPERELFRLLEAHCLELDGNPAAAAELYASIAASGTGAFQGYEAASRLHQLERMQSRGVTREQLAQRAQEPLVARFAVKPRHRIDPIYPPVLFNAGVQGWVFVEIEISPSGAVIDPIVLDSEPPFVFDGAALAVIRNWIYEPTGQSEPIPARVRMNFTIDSGSQTPESPGAQPPP
jgi:TonB family protein